MRKGFIFYRDRCVGCEACTVACLLENGPVTSQEWRTVYHLNEEHSAGIPVFSWSMACNHCQEAACLQACPADAYCRDPETGAVILNVDECIGCTYCQWACPYDAPVFNHDAGIMSKCTQCIHRTTIGVDPACVTGCPVGALDFGPLEEEKSNIPPEFPKTELNPALQIITGQKIPKLVSSYAYRPEEIPVDSGSDSLIKSLSMKREWPLYLFTLLMPLMVGLMARYMILPNRLLGVIYLVAGLIAGITSLSHLGRKGSAWKALKNLKYSWLSREILGFVLTYLSGALYLFFPERDWLVWIALSVGIITLIAMDQVYAYAARKYLFMFHSSNVLLTGFLWVSIAWLQARPILFIGILKIVITFVVVVALYKGRRIGIMKMILYALRILFTAIAVTYLFTGPAYLPYIFSLFLGGELIDRFLFYDEQELYGIQSHFQGWKNRQQKSQQVLNHLT